MVVALVQKCARDARAKGREPPTNLGFLLEEFFNFYGSNLNYATTGQPRTHRTELRGRIPLAPLVRHLCTPAAPPSLPRV